MDDPRTTSRPPFPPQTAQVLGSRDPFSQHGRGPSLLEFLDWMISMGAGFACAYLLYEHATPKYSWSPRHPGATLVAATTLIVGVIDLMNKRTRMQLNLPAEPGSAVTGTVVTLLVFGAAGALFYNHRDILGLVVLLVMYQLTLAERRLLRKKAREQESAAGFAPGTPLIHGAGIGAPHSGQAGPGRPPRA